jgi:hypothetical protein
MKKIENYGVQPLNLEESYIVNGGNGPAEGSYGVGFAIGSWIRDAFTNFSDYYRPTHIWGA